MIGKSSASGGRARARYDKALRERIDRLLLVRAGIGGNLFLLIILWATWGRVRAFWLAVAIGLAFSIFRALFGRRVQGMMDRRLANVGFFVGNAAYGLGIMWVCGFHPISLFIVPMIILFYDGFSDGDAGPLVVALLAIFAVVSICAGAPPDRVAAAIALGGLIHWFSEGRARTLRAALADARDANRRLGEAHAALEKRATELAEAQATAQLGSWDWSFASNEFHWSDELYRICGVDAAEHRPTRDRMLARLHPDDRPRVESAVRTTRRTNRAFALEHRIVRPDGDTRVVFSRGRIVLNDAGEQVSMLGTCQDITEQRRLEERLRQSEKLSAIGQLAAGVAHEINNPLTVILGFAQGMERQLDEANPARMPVKSIVRESLRCTSLVRELLTFARTGNKSTDRIDINTLLRGTAQLLESRARTQDTSLVLELDSEAPEILANRTQLQQVIVNLGNNALDAMERGGQLTLRSSYPAGGELHVEVRDTGPGIPEEIRGKIFEPFFTTKEVGKGTGLGLSLVHEIVEQHSGAIDLRSEVGAGTVMDVRLPVGGLRLPVGRLRLPVGGLQAAAGGRGAATDGHADLHGMSRVTRRLPCERQTP